MIRTRKRQLIHVNCPRCKKRCAIRYWNEGLSRTVCYECVPRDVRHLIPKQTDSDPDARPMALG